jgi:hypothetical protein
MQDIDPLPEEQASQARNQAQRQRGFPANRPTHMLGTGSQQLREQPTTAGDDQ